MTATPARAPVVCRVSLRARVTVGEPFFEHGRALTLGRVGSVDARPGDLVAVEVTGPGRGVVVARLGPADDVAAVLHGVAFEAGAAAPWPAEVAAEVARLPQEPPNDRAGRADLRAVLTFTIDPADARDHDDALSVDGDRVLVHIADVAAFVPEEGAIEAEAARRATSVYLPGRVDPMLPDGLSSGLCSLLPGHDRWAVTVEVGGTGPLRAYRSVIRSDHRLTYEEAELMLTSGEGPSGLVAALRRLDQLARDRAAARLARGGVSVETAERTFRIAAGEVMDGHRRTAGAAHGLVEELMLAANEAVATELAAAGAAMPFRVHEPPEPAALDALVERLEALGVPTPPVAGDALGRRCRPLRRTAQPDGGGIRPHVGPRPRRVPGHGAAGAPQGSLRPGKPRPRRPREPRILPLHLADPPPSRPDGSPGAPAASGRRCTRPRRHRMTWPRRPSMPPRPSARRNCWSAAGTTSAPPSCSTTCCTSRAGRRRFRARWSA